MSLKPYFSQKCPSCHRRASIDVEQLGFAVLCKHCNGEFIAADHEQDSAALEDPMNFWTNFTQHDLENHPPHNFNRRPK